MSSSQEFEDPNGQACLSWNVFPCITYSIISLRLLTLAAGPFMARCSFGTSALLFETLLSLTVQETSKTISQDVHVWFASEKYFVCMSPRVFYYVIVELCGRSVVFWHCAVSLGVARQAGSGYFAYFCPLSRIFMNEIRLMPISFSCALFTDRVTKTREERTWMTRS